MVLAIVALMSGLVMLIMGAEYFVRSAVVVASKLKIPTLIIGLTVVALGTSVPEFVVSLKSALYGSADISVGNVIGSNIANVLLVLGASALIFPVSCDGKAFYRDFSFLFMVTLVFAFFVVNGKLVNWNGWVMLTMLVLFVLYNYYNSKEDNNGDDELPLEFMNSGWLKVLFMMILGVGAIVWGADLLIYGAVEIAKTFGVSETIIGVTVVAIGTSAPELATSCVAAFRKQNGIALGNVLGSNIWNIVFIMGATSAITEVKVADQFVLFDLWVMLFGSFMLLPIMMFKNKITRIEGAFMFLAYVFYIYAQILLVQGKWYLH